MHRWNAPLLVVFALLLLPSDSLAQSDLLKRIKGVTEVPIWRREPIGQKEVRQLLKDVHSSDKKTMQAAFERLALSRPQPALVDVVVAETQNAAKQSRDKFATSMAFEIKHAWTDAKLAAETLQVARRSGGFRYLEQVIARGNASQIGASMIAVAYSGDRRAGPVLGQYWTKNKIVGKRALLILGPPAADTLVKQLDAADNFVIRDVIEVLGKIGTDEHIPALKKLMGEARPTIRRQISDAIQEIEAR